MIGSDCWKIVLCRWHELYFSIRPIVVVHRKCHAAHIAYAQLLDDLKVLKVLHSR